MVGRDDTIRALSALLMTRRFAPLFWTQFFSAFSDNFLKNALVFLILFAVVVIYNDLAKLPGFSAKQTSFVLKND